MQTCRKQYERPSSDRLLYGVDVGAGVLVRVGSTVTVGSEVGV